MQIIGYNKLSYTNNRNEIIIWLKVRIHVALHERGPRR
jgi:hypothetical protein